MSRRQSAWHFGNNWRSFDGPMSVKIQLVMKNNAIKIRKRSSCCGNYGEPGC